MTAISRDELNVGDIIRIVGYGGFAEVLHIEQDGYTPPPNSVPKYRVTIKWGPNNSLAGSAKKKFHIDKNTRSSGLVEDFALGRCRWPNQEDEILAQNKQQAAHQDSLDAIDHMDEQELINLIAKLKESA